MGCCRIKVPLLSSLLIWTCISAFNLDKDNVIIKSGDRDSLFGFSLAMHHQLNPEKRHLLVGAPRASGLGAQASSKTGGLYTCDINAPGTACQRVRFDETVDNRRESKDDQWLGVVVQSQGPGGKVLTCAHRYQQRQNVGLKQESRDILGRCYMLGEDLTITDGNDGEGGQWMLCRGRARGHERFGSCQQGMSATFTKDYHYLIFGAPGAYNWRGIVRVEHRNDTLTTLQLNEGIYSDGPYEVGDENNPNEDLVPVPASSYLGFSLDSGKSITKKGQLIVVAGAPRANHSGEVVFLTIKPDVNMMSTELILKGEGLASSFGYDLTVVDLNGDGWQDLVVGAPQFFLKDGEVGGAIYVYINKKGQWDNIQPTRIDGAMDSMFGLAVENIGDLNLDTYADVAVGAPYDGDGTGKVFIYHGSAEGIKTKPAQVLSGMSGVKLFGYSLAGNMDLDRNGYPDVAIGSLSDSVYIYRTRPVIGLEIDVKIPQELDLKKKNCDGHICLDVEACFAYTAKPATINPTIRLKYLLQTEMERKQRGVPSRVTLSSGQDYESTATLELLGQNARKCIKNQLKLKDNIEDKYSGIPIEVSVELDNGKRGRRALPDLAPILDPNKPTSVKKEVNFVKEGCGSDNICQSNLAIKYQFCSRTPNTDIFAPLHLRGNKQLITLNNQKDVALEVTVTNKNGDDAYETSLKASFPKTLSYSASRTLNTDKQVICTANQNGSQAECKLGNPFKKNAEMTFYIILSTGGISADTTEIEIDLNLTTTSQQQGLIPIKAKADVEMQLLLSVTGLARPSQVYYSGEVKGESAMQRETDIGSLIEFEFRIIDPGNHERYYKRPALTIHWPEHNEQGKRILYLMSISTSGVTTHCSHSEKINELNVEESPARRKREVASQTAPKEGSISLRTVSRTNKTLSCDIDAKCFDIRCPLQGMKSNTLIKLTARLWNSTFLEDYTSLSYLNVLVKATLSLGETAANIKLEDSKGTASVTVFPERPMAQYSGMPWWIILVAILLGLLLLALLIFLLWKCGFFGNKDDDPSEKEKLTSEA